MLDRLVSFLVRSAFIPLFGYAYHMRVYGKEHLPPGGGLLAANHCSFLDPPLIGYCVFPRRLCYLARATLFKSILGWVLRHIGCVPIKRGQGNAAIFKIIPQLTQEGKLVVVFPEGMRSKDGELQPAEAGIGLLVQKTQASVTPCYIHGTFEAWGPHRRLPKLWGETTCIFGSPLHFECLGRDKKAGQQEIVRAIMQAISELRQWYLNGAQGSPP